MTDLLPDTQTRNYSLPAASRSKRVNRAAESCLLSLIPLTLLMIEMHPRVPTFVSVLLVGLPLTSVVLAVFGRKKNATPKAPKRSLGSTVTAVGVIVALVVLFIAILTPTLCRAREPANRVKCASNLRQIGLALTMYAEAHDGSLPATLDALIADPIGLSPEVFACPSSPDERVEGNTVQEVISHFREQPNHLSYVYLGTGMSNKMQSNEVIMYEHPENHKRTGGTNVLFGDGHVEFYEKKPAEKLLAELAAGRNPPRPAAK